MNIIKTRHSDPIVNLRNTNNSKIPKDGSKRTMDRRNSWAGEVVNDRQFLSCHNIGIRPSTTSTARRRKPLTKYSLVQTNTKSFYIHSFSARYQELCERYCVIPQGGILSHLPRRTLDFLADRLKADDWKPFLEALSSDQELHMIAIRSRYPVRNVVAPADTKEKAVKAKRCPLIFTHYYLMGLTASLVECLKNNSYLTCLELEGILLAPKYLSILAKGLIKSESLQHISFERCYIGDEGVEIVCKAIRQLPKVVTLNVTTCGLTPIGLGYISSLLKTQKMNHFIETWQQSLRYQCPNLDSMWGLRRITLNCNPLIGDEGVKILCDALEDDLWVKAIDLQKSGIGESGAQCFISLLNFNVTIAIIDVRENKNIPAALFKNIMQLLSTNNKPRKSEYHWISLPSSSHSISKQKSVLEKNWELHRKLLNQHLSSSSYPALRAKKSTVNNRPHSQPIKGSRFDAQVEYMRK